MNFGINDIWSYMKWSDLKIINILENISDEDYNKEFNALSGNIRSKASHIISIYEYFIALLRKEQIDGFPDKSGLSRTELISLWKKDLQELERLMTKEQGLIALPLAGNQRVQAKHIYLDASLHTIHHKGQILTMLRMMGKSKEDLHPRDTNMDYLWYLFSAKKEEIRPAIN
ncbi:Uncharacterized damage-inducible protein DinB (forms a four-helix bundle) [Ekhidna lutea]|uniref:Uncharacterized damage-inducible protein DinB (Forms a four-helix bundle) n=1 Tax=Ekhidna lutea TaxID=447679 RepID=A0A239GTE6_EKHLU|nr:DinB family protein [Ekhidna lutea]SNS72397.1 Uncharacterized damage-inducible protein DinB (forms a four-helix bundle) [Ekhidna lutea]